MCPCYRWPAPDRSGCFQRPHGGCVGMQLFLITIFFHPPPSTLAGRCGVCHINRRRQQYCGPAAQRNVDVGRDGRGRRCTTHPIKGPIGRLSSSESVKGPQKPVMKICSRATFCSDRSLLVGLRGHDGRERCVRWGRCGLCRHRYVGHRLCYTGMNGCTRAHIFPHHWHP